jgi:hypothetical protein
VFSDSDAPNELSKEGSISLDQNGLEDTTNASLSRSSERAEASAAPYDGRLLELAERYGVAPEDVDDLVHDVHSREASDINNGGLSAQLDYLVGELGEGLAEAEIRDLVVGWLGNALAPIAKRIDEVSSAWNAAEEVDADLGTEVERVGSGLVELLRFVADTMREQHPMRSSALSLSAIDLGDAVDAYTDRAEPKFDYSVDIFDRLAPGVELVRRAMADVEARETDGHATTERPRGAAPEVTHKPDQQDSRPS